MGELKWTSIGGGTEYAKIRGGWLVRTFRQGSQYHPFGWGGLTFIPDADHTSPPEPLA